VPPDELAGVAGVVGGIHAQVMSAAEISLALRVRDAMAADVRSAVVTDHSLIKTFGARGTVHLMPASGLGHWMAALRALPAQRSPFSAGRRAHVTVEPLKPLSDRRTRALEREVERLGEILGKAPTLTIGPIAVGPHA